MYSNHKMDSSFQNYQFMSISVDKVPFLNYLYQSQFPLKKIPVKIVIEDESIKTDLKTDNNNEGSIDFEIMPNPLHKEVTNSNYKLNIHQPIFSENNAFYNSLNFEFSKLSSKVCNTKYNFSITRSRKKEKKFIHRKINNIISRVHNMDCLLKKIKAKYLKFLFLNLKKDLKKLNIDVRKFDQCREVRNLNVPHNRDNFINLTILQVLVNNQIIDENDLTCIINSNNSNLIELLKKKIKYHFQFDFMKSNYFKCWLKDPIKIYENDIKLNNSLIEKKNEKFNKNCLKFPNHSKNIFQLNQENYEIYKKLLLQTTNNFIFYFQNNPLKFGKKQRNN